MTEETGSSKNSTINAPSEHARIIINKWKVREGYPINNSQIVLLYEINEEQKKDSNKSIYKLKANRVGVVKKRLYKENDIVLSGAAILELAECSHTTTIKDMCANCGADLRQNEEGNISQASVPMVHSVPDLKVTQQLAQQLGRDDTRRLLQDRKLVLLVDLDQTVIHTTNDAVPNNIKGIYHFQLYGPNSPWYHTRLRPGTSQFLESMSKYYELHICTFGARNYAHMIAKLLDPKGEFFSHRILSRDECFNLLSKTDNLKALFPNGDSMVCIIDDREDVWNMASNLIQVKPYHFFQHTGDINAPPGLSKTELDGEGVDFKDIDGLTDEKCSVTEALTSVSETAKENKPDSIDTVENETVASNTTDVADDEPAKLSSNSESTNAEATSTENSSLDDENIEHDSASTISNKLETDAQIRNTAEPKESQETNKIENRDDDKETVDSSTSTCSSPTIKLTADAQKGIEIEDSDDYLLYLEVILKAIHTRFYTIYDKTQEIPDLKIVVPKMRSEVLLGQNLVFSGLVPTNMKLEQSRAYFIAKSLGANVSQNIGPETTHLVAVTSGTFKVNAAKKNSNIRIVNSNWLWTCAERWEHVEEKLYPLDRKTKGKQRQPPAHCHSPEHVVNYNNKSEISSSSAQQQNDDLPEKFQDTINPLLSFSCAELADMNKEYDQFFDSDSSSEDEHINIENPPIQKSLRKRKRDVQGEERAHDFFTRSTSMIGSPTVNEIERSSSEEDNQNDEDEDDESPAAKFRRGEDLPSDLDIDSESNDSDNKADSGEDDGDWNMLGAALEREFLGLQEDSQN